MELDLIFKNPNRIKFEMHLFKIWAFIYLVYILFLEIWCVPP